MKQRFETETRADLLYWKLRGQVYWRNKVDSRRKMNEAEALRQPGTLGQEPAEP